LLAGLLEDTGGEVYAGSDDPKSKSSKSAIAFLAVGAPEDVSSTASPIICSSSLALFQRKKRNIKRSVISNTFILFTPKI